MAKCKNTILNEMVQHAAEIMNSKRTENVMIIELLEEKGKTDPAERLAEQNLKIANAIELMEEFAGCWA